MDTALAWATDLVAQRSVVNGEIAAMLPLTRAQAEALSLFGAGLHG